MISRKNRSRDSGRRDEEEYKNEENLVKGKE
jgi:hypothetical protein